MSRSAPPEFLTADPLATATSGVAVARLCESVLAHGEQLVARLCHPVAINPVTADGPEAPGALAALDEILGTLDEIQYAVRLIRGFAGLLAEVHPDAEIRDVARSYAPRAERLETEPTLSPALAARIKGLIETLPEGALEGPRARMVDHVLRAFRRNGLDLPPAEQAELRRLNDDITRACVQFQKNLAEAQAEIQVPPAALAGLPAEYVADRQSRALPGGDVTITTDYPDLFPFIKYATDRAAARALYAAFDDRAAAANVPLLERLLALRERKARLLGYATWADYAIEPRMAGDATSVRQFLETVRDAVKGPAAAEMAELRAMHERLGGHHEDPIYPSDRYYLEERVRQLKYGFDSQQLSQYFEVRAVMDGLFDLTARLFGITYRRVPDAPVWHDDVEAYDVLADGRVLGRLVFDLFPRANKFKHAGTFEIRPAWVVDGERRSPIGAMVCNFPRPGGDQPALMTHEEVVIFFHEFGHLLHEIVFARSPYVTLDANAMARDFIEVPSQVFEEWAFQREVLDGFARHHKTGEKIPDALYTAMTEARRFGRAVMTQIQLFLSAIDLAYHSRPAGFDTTELLRQTFLEYQPFAYLEGTHYQATFVHLVSYDAAYYGYQWALSLTCDVLTRFAAEGFLNAATAQDWRAAVLEPGGSEDEASLVERFLGRRPSARAYFERLQRA